MAIVAGSGTAAMQQARRGARNDEDSWDCRGDRDPSPMLLAQLIEGEIIPRLLLAHQENPANDVAEARPGVPDGMLATFAPLTLQLEVHGLLVHIDALLGEGVPVEAVLTDLLAPTARRLGEFWDNDECDFVDVTMGLWRLQQIVHELAAREPNAGMADEGARHALFALPPGDQHSLGSIIIEEFFRRAGWRTWNCGGHDESELLASVGERHYELIGLTVTCADTIDGLAPLIASLRAASRNPSVAVMVGGWLFTEHPELAVAVGADGTAADGDSAVRCAEALVAGASWPRPLPH